jgi:hypothetical protein
VAVSAQPDAIDIGFWRAVLGYAPLAEDNSIELVHGCTAARLHGVDAGIEPRQTAASRHAPGRVRAA